MSAENTRDTKRQEWLDGAFLTPRLNCPRCGAGLLGNRIGEVWCSGIRCDFVATSARSPQEVFARPTCRGSIALGTACGNCERCDSERGWLAVGS